MTESTPYTNQALDAALRLADGAPKTMRLHTGEQRLSGMDQHMHAGSDGLLPGEEPMPSGYFDSVAVRIVPGRHPKGNRWFVDQLDADDPDYDCRAQWGVFLQLEGYVQQLGSGFPDEDSAWAFIRDEIIGAPASTEN